MEKTKPINKKIATAALAGILAMGAFSAAPAFAGSGSNGCSASGCGKKAEKSGCKSAHECKGKGGCEGKGGCKSSGSCKSKSGCESKSGCKSSGSCKGKGGCEGKSKKSHHNDNGRYN